jgi:oxaloacetate decarboxylase gamma subunit
MNDMALLIESLRLLVIGMGIVFAFLALLVGVVRLMSWSVMRLEPARPRPAAAGPPPAPSDQSDDLIAVISAAIACYRARR